MSISVRLGATDLVRARELAETSYNKFANSRGYYRNTPNSHIVGKIGEIAAESWLKSAHLPVFSLYDDATQAQSADLEIAGIRIEVKAWTHDWWADWGRCIAVGQLAALREKSDCVLWVSAKVTVDSALVFFHGWSTVREVEQAPVRWTGPTGRKVKNHQLNQESLRDAAELLEALHTKYSEASGHS
jgi:hypothetical protein